MLRTRWGRSSYATAANGGPGPGRAQDDQRSSMRDQAMEEGRCRGLGLFGSDRVKDKDFCFRPSLIVIIHNYIVSVILICVIFSCAVP